jgi:hypothetical protein
MSCPTPLALPTDFISPLDGSCVRMETINMPLAEKCTLNALESQICLPLKVDLADVVASIFCATVSRITGHPDGSLRYSKSPETFQTLCFDISPADTM